VSALQQGLSVSAMSAQAPDKTDPLRHLDFTGSCRELSRPRREARRLRCVPGTWDRYLGSNPPEQLNPFIRWVFAQAGLHAAGYRSAVLQRRLSSCLRALRASGVEEARAILERDPSRLNVAINALLVGVTEFFRDPVVFDDLRRIISSLARGGRLRIWSAACAQGQELYSLALMLAELNLLSGSDLLGTDCRADAIAWACRGEYARLEIRSIRPVLREKWFIPVKERPERVRVATDLRRYTRWQVDDLLRGVQPGPWDLICWRNHAIYLAPETTRAVWRRLVRELRPGGLLLTGRAEGPDRALPLTRVAGCIYRKR